MSNSRAETATVVEPDGVRVGVATLTHERHPSSGGGPVESSDIVLRVRSVSKHYLLFDRPQDRIKQSIVPRLQRLAGRAPKFYYRDFAALRDVSFEVRRGETVGLIGRNGSGKSTLLQIVCGTLRPNAGEVEVNGRIAALLELGAGFNPDFTGRENVYMNAAILGLPRREVDARFYDIARFADIGAFIDQPVKTYSSGMYVRLAFATAINVDPDILVVDEALAVGDEAFQRKCFARIEQIQERGGTILFVTHGTQTVVQLCTRALLFDAGELILDGRPKLVTRQYQRLVNASPEMAADIRAAIVTMREAASAEPAPETDEVPAPINGCPIVEEIDAHQEPRCNPLSDMVAPMSDEATAADTTAVPNAPPAIAAMPPADYFAPNLKPQSTMYFEERGARIRDVRITTLRGEPVNVLQSGKRYVFQYSVDFTKSARNVGFATYIKTVTGQGVAGGSTLFNKDLRTPSVSSGTVANVRFEFDCLLLPGVYFWNAGVVGDVDGERYYLHRIIDVLAARIPPSPDLTALGVVDLGVTPYVDLKRI